MRHTPSFIAGVAMPSPTSRLPPGWALHCTALRFVSFRITVLLWSPLLTLQYSRIYIRIIGAPPYRICLSCNTIAGEGEKLVDQVLHLFSTSSPGVVVWELGPIGPGHKVLCIESLDAYPSHYRGIWPLALRLGGLRMAREVWRMQGIWRRNPAITSEVLPIPVEGVVLNPSHRTVRVAGIKVRCWGRRGYEDQGCQGTFVAKWVEGKIVY